MGCVVTNFLAVSYVSIPIEGHKELVFSSASSSVESAVSDDSYSVFGKAQAVTKEREPITAEIKDYASLLTVG